VAVGFERGDESEVVRVFGSNVEFSQWVDTSAVRDQVQSVLTQVKTIGPESASPAWLARAQRIALQHKMDAFNAFAKLLELEPKSEEMIRLSAADRAPATPRLFDPVASLRSLDRAPTPYGIARGSAPFSATGA
jgi:hypothetical protein